MADTPTNDPATPPDPTNDPATPPDPKPQPTPAAGVIPQAAAPTHAPFFLVSPSFKIGPTGTLVDLKCSANQIAHGIDQDSNDYDTFCGSYRSYGVPHETITLTMYQNFDTDGPWHTLSPLRGQVVDFELLADDRLPIGPTNPQMEGQVYVPAVPFIDAAVNEASEFDIELAIQGTPAFVVVPGP